MTTVFFTLATLATLGVVIAVALGRITGGLDDPTSSLPARGLPAGPVRSSDVQAVRFSPALRGYRMDEVDRVVDTLARELRRREAEVASLRERLGASGGQFPPDAPPPEPAGWFGTGPLPLLHDAGTQEQAFPDPASAAPAFPDPGYGAPVIHEQGFHEQGFHEQGLPAPTSSGAAGGTAAYPSDPEPFGHAELEQARRLGPAPVSSDPAARPAPRAD